MKNNESKEVKNNPATDAYMKAICAYIPLLNKPIDAVKETKKKVWLEIIRTLMM